MAIVVYKATNIRTKKAYIGFTESSLDIRKAQHFRDAKFESATHFHRSLRKHGSDSWKWEIVDTCKTRELAGIRETQLISENNTFVNGYNSTTGGEFGYTLSAEVRVKRKHPKSTETRKRMSEAHTGKKVTQKTRERMSIAHTGKIRGPQSPEHIQKQADSHRGTKHGPLSRAAKRKISIAKTGFLHKIVECPNCKKTGGENIMPRWHFDNCRYSV